MNKQIAIFATTCLVVSVVIAANILPRVLAQVTGDLEKQVQSKASATNATKNQKTNSLILICDEQVLPTGVKYEDHCKVPSKETGYPHMLTCVNAAKDWELICDDKPIR